MLVAPEIALLDAPVSIRLQGLSSGQKVLLRAWIDDSQGNRWASWAPFRADDDGAIDVRIQRPEEGTYQDADPMGLFWSMNPLPIGGQTRLFTSSPESPLMVTLAAEADGTLLMQKQLTRLFLRPGVRKVLLQEQSLVGSFFLPDSPDPCPGLLLLGGSSGTALEQQAALLASHGYCTLALAYFGRDHLPPELTEIPLEYFGQALQWLQNQAEVLPTKLAVLGVSKGAEAALLLASTFESIKAVVGYAPSAVVYEGLTGREENQNRSSWSYQGKPWPFLSQTPPPSILAYEQQCLRENIPIAFCPRYLSSLAERRDGEQATIPVEKINGPVLLISGQDDQMWPSAHFGFLIEQRLKQHSFPHDVRHLTYENAGHKIGIPFLPATTLHQMHHAAANILCAYGGTPAGNAFASAHSWQNLLTFLEKSL
ncbi:MAG TPA: acyl-CoA thioesterase/bile acid-CoA:amino acid N-acyltransferase family protein [Ktedonobacteraceae bacterium]|nr:acyl-CoA thioesterase/bile acid-CoA:amino acid N-acyltransferase family protein [Ktedonobacteraceae bacterium]